MSSAGMYCNLLVSNSTTFLFQGAIQGQLVGLTSTISSSAQCATCAGLGYAVTPTGPFPMGLAITGTLATLPDGNLTLIVLDPFYNYACYTPLTGWLACPQYAGVYDDMFFATPQYLLGLPVPLIGALFACPAGKYSLANASICLTCPNGTFSASGSSTCARYDSVVMKSTSSVNFTGSPGQSFSWTVPTSVVSLTVYVIGAGGRGYNPAGLSAQGGGGGGGAAVVTVAVSAGQTVNISFGAPRIAMLDQSGASRLNTTATLVRLGSLSIWGGDGGTATGNPGGYGGSGGGGSIMLFGGVGGSYSTKGGDGQQVVLPNGEVVGSAGAGGGGFTGDAGISTFFRGGVGYGMGGNGGGGGKTQHFCGSTDCRDAGVDCGDGYLYGGGAGATCGNGANGAVKLTFTSYVCPVNTSRIFTGTQINGLLLSLGL
jgi:hypothetical protein